MKNNLLTCAVIFILSFSWPTNGFAKESIKGYEFWLGFFNNNITNEKNDLLILITSEEFTKGVVSVPKLNWSQDFTVTAGAMVTVSIPANLVNHEVSGIIELKGIKVTATEKINVFAVNSSEYTTDGSYIFPKQNLQKNYWVMSYQGFSDTPNEILIVATEDDTQIEIIPSVETENGHLANAPFNIILNEGESYLLRTKPKGDITGTRIRGIRNCNPFAVFSGAKGTHIPFDCSAVDHIFHQMLPDNHLGKKYLLSPINNDFSCRILATEDNTLIWVNGQIHVTLQKGQHSSLHRRKNALLIEASKPVVVAQFLQGTMCSAMGDPGMAIVPPINKLYQKVQIAVPGMSNIEKGYVDIITRIVPGNQVKVNGVLINGFTPIAALPDYGFKKVEVDFGSVRLEADSGLIAMAYGIGWANSYLFSAGYQDDISMEVKIDKNLCVGVPANFICNVEGASGWSWDFGDTKSGSGKSVIHHYQSPGTFQVTLTIYLNEECPIIYKDLIKIFPYPQLGLPKEAAACGDYEIILSAKEKGLKYYWSTGETTQSIRARTSGSYILEASNGICASSDTVEVFMTPYPHLVEISPDTTIFINNSAQVKASGGNVFQWSPPDGLSCTSCAEPMASPRQTTTYTVKIYDNTGCMALDSVTVNVDKDLRVYIPNIFSPNNDGQNDILFVRGKGIKDIKFLVYNRWGEKVFESTNVNHGWDGTFRGAQLPPSVFVFYLDALMESGERIIRKGDVTLIK